MRPRPHRTLQFRIVTGVVVVMLVAIGGLFYLLRYYYRERMLANVQGYAVYLSQTVENAFDFAMTVHSMAGLRETVERLDKHRGVKRIFLIDRERKVVMGSPKSEVGTHIPSDDPSCQVCHDKPPEERSNAVVLVTGGESVLRVAVPIRNDPQCQTCHGHESKMRGMVILDYALDEVQGALSPSVVGMSTLFVATTLGLVVAIGFLMNRLVVRKLTRLGEAAHAIGRGEFSRRVDTSGGDEFGRLGASFNDMAGRIQRFTTRIEEDRDFLNRLINSIEDEIVVFDGEFQVIAANRAATAATTPDPSSIPCQQVCKMRGDLCSDGGGAEGCLVRQTFRTGRRQRAVHHYSAEGRTRYVEVVTIPIFDNGEDVRQVLYVCRDITERRSMESELIRSERLAALGRLAAGVAHEINNPMASIAACAEGLQRRLRDFDPSESPEIADLPEYIETIRRAAYESKAIAGKLLDLSRKPEIAVQEVDPNAVVEEVLGLLGHALKSGEIDLRADLDPGVPRIRADRARLAHAVLNTVSNALDAVGEGGEIHVITRRHPGGAQIVVEDNGCGIPEDDLGRIFEPFYTTKPPGKGTGLGLSISERTVRDHGGSIDVRSELGKGTTFCITLPVSAGNGIGSDAGPGGGRDE